MSLSTRQLAEMYPEPGKPPGTRVVDKLVKVYQKDGKEQWMLLHVEVQGTSKKDFSRRMFEYYYRLVERYHQPVAAVVIFTGRDGRTLPQVFEAQCLWTKVRYDYKTLFISDYSETALALNNNPFACILMIAKEIQSRKKKPSSNDEQALLEHKLMIVRLVKERLPVWGEKKAAAVLTFLNNYVSFKKSETNRIFMEQTDVIIGKKNTMGIIEALAEYKAEEAREKALKKGRKEGLREGKMESIRILLKHSDLPPEKIASIFGVPLSQVKEIKSTVQPPTTP